MEIPGLGEKKARLLLARFSSIRYSEEFFRNLIEFPSRLILFNTVTLQKDQKLM
jgi:hypothetical protein